MSVYSYNSVYALTTALATTQEVSDFGEARYMMVYVPATSTLTTLTFYASPQPGGTYYALYNGTTAVTLTVAAGRCYKVPLDIQGARALKMVAAFSDSVTTANLDVSFQEQ